MEILGQKGLGKILKIILIMVFIIGIPGIIISPLLLNHMQKITYSMFIIYPNGFIMLCIVYHIVFS